MRIVAKKALVQFYTIHKDAQTAIEDWNEKTERANWDCFADVKRTFGSADSVGTHTEYDQIKDIENI